MKFSTPVEIEKIPENWLLSHSDEILLLGSCFAENIGDKFSAAAFKSTVNPFGTLYNPLSISSALARLISGKNFEKSELFFASGLWQSFSHHGRFSSPDKTETLSAINSEFSAASEKLQKLNFLIITFGTAWIYRLKSTGEVIANCHKLPAQNFLRARLTVAETVEALADVFEKLLALNPDLKIILTVSPIRHLKDTAHGNNLSKAVLLLACEELERRFPSVKYFPSYEILLDELRDYRFFADDLVHPSPIAVDFIWEKFSQNFFSQKTLQNCEKILRLRRAQNHRPLHASPDFLKFQQETARQIAELEQLLNIKIK